MRSRYKRLGVAAVATMFAFAGAGGSAVAAPDSGAAGKSSADIEVNDCVVESSKEISYVEFFSGGESVEKDESVDAESLDLTTVEGIDDVDEVEVKAGTTVETFGVECAFADGTAGGTGDQEGTDSGGPDSGDGTETGDDTETGEGTETGDDIEGAVITLSGCTVESTKDISNIEFFSDGTSWKDESMNSETFDLTTVEGIDDVHSIRVKSSTTVEEFSISCIFGDDSVDGGGDGSTADAAGSQDSETKDSETHDSETESETEVEAKETETEVEENETDDVEDSDESEEKSGKKDEDEADDDEEDDEEDDSEETEDD